jgi:hypothetical protein
MCPDQEPERWSMGFKCMALSERYTDHDLREFHPSYVIKSMIGGHFS